MVSYRSITLLSVTSGAPVRVHAGIQNLTHCCGLQAAQAMQQYSGWAPKEFDEAALDTSAAATDPSASSAAQQEQPGAGLVGGQEQSQAPRPAPDPSTFVYDPNTGAP